MQDTNVELSKKELLLVSDSEFILTKNRIIEKVYSLFGMLSEDYKKILNDNKEVLPGEILKSSAKISRGENYLGLPYVMLDYPRLFSRQDVFAIRCFFWWGNYFSITLQLSGSFLETYKQNILQNLSSETDDFFICVNDNEWQHDFEEKNYLPLKNVNIESSLQKPFLKLAKKISLEQWNDASFFFKTNYQNLIKLLL